MLEIIETVHNPCTMAGDDLFGRLVSASIIDMKHKLKNPSGEESQSKAEAEAVSESLAGGHESAGSRPEPKRRKHEATNSEK
jgi:hypothetical protein